MKLQLRNSDCRKSSSTTRALCGRHNFRAFTVFHFFVYCKLAKNYLKTFSVDKVSALHLKGKQFLSNVYDAERMVGNLATQ